MIDKILIFIGFLILVYYTKSELKELIAMKKETEPTPEPVQVEPEPQPAPQIIPQPQPAPVEPIPEPEPQPEPPKIDRKQLEQIARNCLAAAGCKFDAWSYCRYKSDVELMDIIKDYNLNK